MKKKLLVIGAGNYQVPIIKRAVERGIEVYCVDYNPNAEGYKYADGYEIIDACDKDACLKYAQKLNVDGVVTYGATLTLPTVSYIGEKLSLPAIGEKTAEISKNKYQIKKLLAENGCNIKGEFFELRPRDERRGIKIPCVIKPSDGSGSKGVSLVHEEYEIENAINYAFDCSRYGEIYVESFIKGEEYSVEAFVYEDKIYVYLIVKTDIKIKDNELYYTQTSFLNISSDMEKKIFDEVSKAIKALEINFGSVNFDVIISEDDEKPYIIDLGIRIGQNLIASHLVPISRGVSETDNIIDASLNIKPNCEPKRKRFIATCLLTYNPGIIKEIKQFDNIIGVNGVVDVIITRKVGDVLPPYKTKSDICGWVITLGDTPEEANENVLKAREMLKKYIIIE